MTPFKLLKLSKSFKTVIDSALKENDLQALKSMKIDKI